MKGFRFLLSVGILSALLASCGPGEGTNGRTGNYDKHNVLIDDTTDRNDGK